MCILFATKQFVCDEMPAAKLSLIIVQWKHVLEYFVCLILILCKLLGNISNVRFQEHSYY